VESEISDLSEPENASERLLAEQLFETYVPVNLPGVVGSDGVDAVIEVYQDYSAIQREIDRLNDTLTISLGIGLLAIHGYAELLKERAPSADPGTRDAVEAIARQTAHLQRLVGNLLREAQLEHGESETEEEPTSMAEVLEEMGRGFPGAVDRIDVRVEHDLPQRTSDPVALHEIPRIFDLLTHIDQSSTRSHGGVGLRLHLVRELTRRFGGEVAVESVVGRGTTFTVTIPDPVAAGREAPGVRR